jgi:hypothetical protein
MMRIIYSKLKKKEKKRLKKYWRLLEPKKYVDKMTFDYAVSGENVKIAAGKLSEVKLKGVLKQTKEGFVYIKLSNDVIHGLFTLIDEEGIEEPPYFGKGEIGAHISVISDEEAEEKEIEKIDELGEEFSFKMLGMKSVKPKGWKEMARVWFVEFEAPEIEKMRQKYGLPKSYKGTKNKWHVSVAIKKAKK